MAVLEGLTVRLDVYSIDEAFLFVPGIDAVESYEAFGLRVRNTVLQQIGLTCGVGIAQTRTLAKLANHAAKTWPATGGVVALTDPRRQRTLMSLVPVGEVWGVGRQLTHKLQMMGIKTAQQLADANLKMIRQAFGVVLERTVRELNGTPCIEIDSALPAKQQIISSRSFGERITEQQPMREAVCQYAERAAEKLRQERQYCRHISVFLRTSPYSTDPYYSNSSNQALMLATQDTREIVAAAMRALDTIWRPGFRYQKAGVMLNALTDRPGQIDLFDDAPPRANADALMRVVDNINQAGLGKIWFAGQGINKEWAMKREMLSPRYTTNWHDIPEAKLA